MNLIEPGSLFNEKSLSPLKETWLPTAEEPANITNKGKKANLMRTKIQNKRKSRSNTKRYGKNRPKKPVNHQVFGCMYGAKLHARYNAATMMLRSIIAPIETDLKKLPIGYL